MIQGLTVLDFMADFSVRDCLVVCTFWLINLMCWRRKDYFFHAWLNLNLKLFFRNSKGVKNNLLFGNFLTNFYDGFSSVHFRKYDFWLTIPHLETGARVKKLLNLPGKPPEQLQSYCFQYPYFLVHDLIVVSDPHCVLDHLVHYMQEEVFLWQLK